MTLQIAEEITQLYKKLCWNLKWNNVPYIYGMYVYYIYYVTYFSIYKYITD